MSEKHTISVQKGIWIDQGQLDRTGLEGEIQVTVQPGEIRIVGAAAMDEDLAASERVWNVFRSLGKEAQPGRLTDPSTEHDLHLYGETR